MYKYMGGSICIYIYGRTICIYAETYRNIGPIHVYIHICVILTNDYIYIYIEREREREREKFQKFLPFFA
jgi:hypothetical protein